MQLLLRNNLQVTLRRFLVAFHHALLTLVELIISNVDI